MKRKTRAERIATIARPQQDDAYNDAHCIRCPTCGYLNTAGATTCYECGKAR